MEAEEKRWNCIISAIVIDSTIISIECEIDVSLFINRMVVFWRVWDSFVRIMRHYKISVNYTKPIRLISVKNSDIGHRDLQKGNSSFVCERERWTQLNESSNSYHRRCIYYNIILYKAIWENLIRKFCHFIELGYVMNNFFFMKFIFCNFRLCSKSEFSISNVKFYFIEVMLN